MRDQKLGHKVKSGTKINTLEVTLSVWSRLSKFVFITCGSIPNKGYAVLKTRSRGQIYTFAVTNLAQSSWVWHWNTFLL